MIYTHRTAIKRKTASRPMRDLIENGYLLKGKSVLDFGCGWGKDVKYLEMKQDHSKLIDGYDPYEEFGYSQSPPMARYDAVTMIYVANVIPDKAKRQRAIYEAWWFVAPGGFLFLAARTREEVERLAKKHGWTAYLDGYRTKRDTFQKGFNAVELLQFARAVKHVRGSLSEWHVMERDKYVGLLMAKRRWT